VGRGIVPTLDLQNWGQRSICSYNCFFRQEKPRNAGVKGGGKGCRASFKTETQTPRLVTGRGAGPATAFAGGEKKKIVAVFFEGGVKP